MGCIFVLLLSRRRSQALLRHSNTLTLLTFVAGPIRGCSQICGMHCELAPGKRDHARAGGEEGGKGWNTVASFEGEQWWGQSMMVLSVC
ncbi:hypothetical protein BD310DRAFT_918340 [Dichomitus squalens]|uniref:Uncharacterized protein n=1 Tax=Dichomitus squalens TaxID=114155 RepID=A0A4Q9Q719_9APHY|nr:hypothetical protein BD310DRAFT_918340 [Dichomitus squalens]